MSINTTPMLGNPFTPRPSDAECRKTVAFGIARGWIKPAGPEPEAEPEPTPRQERHRNGVHVRRIEVPRHPAPDPETFEGGED
jgi:hypothetical protein